MSSNPKDPANRWVILYVFFNMIRTRINVGRALSIILEGLCDEKFPEQCLVTPGLSSGSLRAFQEKPKVDIRSQRDCRRKRHSWARNIVPVNFIGISLVFSKGELLDAANRYGGAFTICGIRYVFGHPILH